MTVEWTDVTDWQTMWAPEDGDQITATLLSKLDDALRNDAVVFSSQYSFTDASIASVMNQIGKSSAASRFLFDSSCYASSNDKACVTTVITDLQDDQWGVGTSSVQTEILHSKIVCALYEDGTGWTFSGSFNLSESAQKEFNVADFITSRSRAEQFATQIQQKLSWVLTNQQPQPYIVHNNYVVREI